MQVNGEKGRNVRQKQQKKKNEQNHIIETLNEKLLAQPYT